MIESARKGEYEQVSALLSRGARVDADCAHAHTPFALAAKNRHFKLALMLAQHGATDPWGQYYIGQSCVAGIATSKNISQGYAWLRKAADQNLSDAQSALGHMHYYGNGVDKCNKLAIEWLKKAAAQDHCDAMGLLGRLYCGDDDDVQIKDIPKALDLLHRGAQKGSAMAQCKLGTLYWRGLHVAIDPAMAHEMLQKAANQQFPEAQVCLALFYLKSDAAAEKKPQAMELLLRAANRHSVEAMLTLAHIYWHEENRNQAMEMLARCAGLGDPRACLQLARIYENGPNGLEKNITLTMHYYQKAAARNCPRAHYQLGLKCQSEGQFHDLAKARFHFEKAAEQGLADAQFKLGEMYRQAQGIPIDVTKALAWFAKAARQGHQEAKEGAAKCHQYQLSIKRQAEGLNLSPAGHQQECTDALCKVGESCGQGEGFNMNPQKAQKSLAKASEQDHQGASASLAECELAHAPSSSRQTKPLKRLQSQTKPSHRDFFLTP